MKDDDRCLSCEYQHECDEILCIVTMRMEGEVGVFFDLKRNILYGNNVEFKLT